MPHERNLGAAYLLWLFFGICGAHKLYLRRPWLAVLYFCTAGLILVGWIVDLFTMREQVDKCNDEIFDEDDREYLEDRVAELEDEVASLRRRMRR